MMAMVRGKKISRFEAVRLYTVGAAEIIGQHHVRGKIEAGYTADFTVCEEDIFKVDIEKVPHIDVAYTVIEGQIVYAKTKNAVKSNLHGDFFCLNDLICMMTFGQLFYL